MIHEGDRLVTLDFIEEDLTTVLPVARFVVVAAVAAGYKMTGDIPWLDYITGPASLEEFATFPDKKRKIRVVFDGRVKIEFPDGAYDVREYRRRYDDLDWIRAHADHPIAFQRATIERLLGLSGDLRKMKPLLHLHREDRDVYIPQDSPPEKIHALMWWFNHGVGSTPPPFTA